ncbi:hypothetical protein FACS1894120_7090 [Clostridia bacterium]|nr:hypothetical protein FACS1894120_7090 [Clostridia bacterium]
MGKSALFGNYTVSADELTKLKTLAKKSVTMENRNAEWKKKIAAVEQQLADVKMELDSVSRDCKYWKNKFKDLEQMVKPYLTAILNFPEVLKNFIEQHWKERRLEQQQKKSHSKGFDL